MRSRQFRIFVAGIIAVAVAALALGCGGDDDGGDETVSAEEYVSSVCTAIADMGDVLQSSQEELQNALTSPDPEEGKELIVGFLNDAASTVGSAREDLEAAGVPDVENGGEIADALPTAFGEMESAMADAAADAEDIATGSPQAFAQEAQVIGETVQEAGNTIGESLNEIATSEELEAAAEESEACQELVG